MSKIKICGLMRPIDIQYVNEVKPDFAGFILTKGFRRTVSQADAELLSDKLDKSIIKVGVFVNDSLKNIDYFIKNGIIDYVQLHGDESPDYCSKIKGAKIIKMINPNKKNDYTVDDYKNVDFFLFDSGCGSGKSFDWSLLPKTDKPFFLAGGIDENMINAAKRDISPFAFDVSSAAETNGVKDFKKIESLVRSAHNE